MSLITNHERARDTRQKLEKLKNMGYQYVATLDDGETWIGSSQTGLEIEILMHHGFLGNIAIGQEAQA